MNRVKALVGKRTLVVGLYIVCFTALALVWWFDVRDQDKAQNMRNFPSALYYILTGASTIGYGDLYPVTDMGRFGCVVASSCLILLTVLSFG